MQEPLTNWSAFQLKTNLRLGSAFLGDNDELWWKQGQSFLDRPVGGLLEVREHSGNTAGQSYHLWYNHCVIEPLTNLTAFQLKPNLRLRDPLLGGE